MKVSRIPAGRDLECLAVSKDLVYSQTHLGIVAPSLVLAV